MSETGFDARFAAIEGEGRTLLVSRESRVTFLEPFHLAARAESSAVDQAVRRVSMFAFVLSGIIFVLAAVRAAPLPIAGFGLVWIGAALLARFVARKRRQELGRVIVDFENDAVISAPLQGPERTLPLAGARAVSEPSNDGEAPVWIMLHLEGGVRLRLCRGQERDVDRVLTALRKQRVEVVRAHEDR